MTNVLRLDASMRRDGSVTRTLTDRIVARFLTAGASVRTRDLADGVDLVDEAWIGANFTDPAERTPAQQDALAGSDALVAEIADADVLVLGVPVYNFGVPAALKAWVDMIARARETFRYTESGPVGLMTGKRAIVVVASGGTPIGGAIDFATPWLRHVLGFIGIEDVEIVPAAELMADIDGARVRAAEEVIDRLAA